MIPYTIPKRARACSSCKVKFIPGDTCFSELFLQDKGWVRKDLCKECPSEGGEARFPIKIEERETVEKGDPAQLFELFQECLDQQRVAMAYLLAHSLARQKLLLLKKEPYISEGKRGALFQTLDSELLHFLEAPSSFQELSSAREELKKIVSTL